MPQFLILAEDFKDGEALDRRLAVREQHLERARNEQAKGILKVGGATISDAGKMHGSMLVVELENQDAVKQWIAEDPYVTGRVWDEIRIEPFKIAII
ncbi:YciI family protein [Danxiaibacter flavus]|uniref:YciI family protein n=1 Tax=Danxiaibacter flavus TaxID=3049108 RepID=A0ABV3ZHL4_9BACT|nr:YciI family protein [Chitinophagaceae bacterium DXS]